MDKLAIINSMKVLEWDANGSELEYLLVENTVENRNKLMQIGVPYQEIKDATDDLDNEAIDIASIGFTYTGAKWYSHKKGGFLEEIPEDVPKLVKSHG